MYKFVEETERFVLLSSSDEEIGEITWKDKGDYLLVYHTLVGDDFAGQGLAQQLLDHVEEKVRAEGKKIYPMCPFAARQFLKNPDHYEDIWQKK